MKTAANITIWITAIASSLVLAISIYPGVLNDLLLLAVLLSFVVVPVAGVVAVAAVVFLAWKDRLRGVHLPRAQAAVFLALVIGTYLLLKFYVPRRIAFAVSRASFAQMLSSATPSEHQGTSLNQRLGLYSVDQYASDARGGVYFRIYTGADGISPDCMSYGFVYKPNLQGTPFGAARYRLFRLDNNWYWFRASDDWYIYSNGQMQRDERFSRSENS